MVPVFDLLVMLIADIQLIGHLLQRISVLRTKNLHSLSKFHLIENISCPFRRAGEDFVSVRSGQVCGSCKQSKRKSTVEIESLKGYGSPFIRFGFVRCMVVSQSRAPRAAPLTRLKVVCVIRLYVFGFYCAVTAF